MKNSPYLNKQSIKEAVLWNNSTFVLDRLDIELTERCNNNCIHCCINLPLDDKKAKKRELSTDQIKHILKDAVSLGYMSVRFTGGEPLLRGDFEELYIFARKQGLKVLLFTNATLISEHLARLFKRIPFLEMMEVSVYGMKRKSYEAITRVSGSFEAFQRGVKTLREYKIPFIVKSAMLPANMSEIDDFEKWSAEIPWMDKVPSYSMFFDLRCRRDSRKNDLIKRIRLTAQDGLKLLTSRNERYVRNMKEFCSKFTRPPGRVLFSCGAGCGGCVDAYGYFQPCMGLRCPDTAYQLKKGSLKDALVNFFPKIIKINASNPDYLNRCAKCFLKGFCEQCPGKSWSEYGTLDTPVEYHCEIAHVQARYLGLLKEDEMAWNVSNWKKRIKDFAGTNIKN